MISTILIAAVSTFSWTTHIPEGGLQFSERNGELNFRLAGRGAACGGDGYVEAMLPLYKRGSLDFDIRFTPAKDNWAMSLFLTFYNITVFWHDACRDWRVYFPERNFNREQFFIDNTIYDDGEQKTILKELIAARNDLPRSVTPGLLSQLISMAKNQRQSYGVSLRFRDPGGIGAGL